MHGVLYRVWLYVWDVHYVYVHTVEENALGVCHVRQSIRSVYDIRKKVEVKD